MSDKPADTGSTMPAEAYNGLLDMAEADHMRDANHGVKTAGEKAGKESDRRHQ